MASRWRQAGLFSHRAALWAPVWALLVAPQSGERTRDLLEGKAREGARPSRPESPARQGRIGGEGPRACRQGQRDPEPGKGEPPEKRRINSESSWMPHDGKYRGEAAAQEESAD